MAKKPKIPKCVWANWRYCWQREGNSVFMRTLGIPDESFCAACIAARVNWGDNASRRSISKDEMLRELKDAKTN